MLLQKSGKSSEKKPGPFLRANNDTILFAKAYKSGDTIKILLLAQPLEDWLKMGGPNFTLGETAEKLVSFLQEKGGIITLEDFKNYTVKWREPITFTYNKLNIISMSPPSSGGIVMGQIMKMIEPYPIDNYGHNSGKMIQLITEAERRAYADRSFYLGDPDFGDIPVKDLLSDVYLEDRMAGFDFFQLLPLLHWPTESSPAMKVMKQHIFQ